MLNFYAGIGSRETPQNILDYMTDLAAELEKHDFILRSGGAGGADLAFEAGVKDDNNKRIYLPWSGFNGRGESYGVLVPFTTPELEQEAQEIAAHFHPAWDKCSQGAKNLHTRNVAQIFGGMLTTPSLFVVCWTPNGSGSGGTGQALRMADANDIPIFDLGKMTFSEVEAEIDQLI